MCSAMASASAPAKLVPAKFTMPLVTRPRRSMVAPSTLSSRFPATAAARAMAAPPFPHKPRLKASATISAEASAPARLPPTRDAAVFAGRNRLKRRNQIGAAGKPLADFAGNGVAGGFRKRRDQRHQKGAFVVRGDDQKGKERARQRIRQGLAPTPGAPAFFRHAARGFARIAKSRGYGSDREEGKHQQKAFVAPAQINRHAQQKSANRARAVDHLQAERQHRQRQIDGRGQHDAPAKEGQVAVQRAALHEVQAKHEGARHQRNRGVVIQAESGADSTIAPTSAVAAQILRAMLGIDAGGCPARQNVCARRARHDESQKTRPGLFAIPG